MLSQLIKFIRILSSETAPMQISAGFALAMIAGFTPLFSLHNILTLFILLIFRINLAAFLLALVIFSAFAYILDPVFNYLGLVLLNHPDLTSLWTNLYNSGFWKITQFNNTILMGSLTISLLAFFPMLWAGNILIEQYRKNILQYINNSPWFKLIKSSKLFSKLITLSE